MRHEVETHGAKALVMQFAEVGFAETVIGIGYAAVLAAALRNGIDDDRVVDAVAAGVGTARSAPVLPAGA
jgi:uncharacterized protein (DUF111 family)